MNENDNMEDFIKNAANAFNDSPSDAVWENVTSRLDAPSPFFRRWMFWLGCLAVACILGLGVHNFSLHKKISGLEQKMEAQQLDCLAEQNNQQKTDSAEQARTSKTTKITSSISSLNPSEKSARYSRENFGNNLTDDNHSNQDVGFRVSSDRFALSAARNDEIVKKRIDYKKSLSNLSPISLPQKNNLYRPHDSFSSFSTMHALRSHIALPTFRFGITKGTYSAFSDIKTKLKNQQHYGFLAEYFLTYHFAISAELLYSQQELTIDKNDFVGEKMQDYPNIEDLRILHSIESKSRFLQLPIGLRWRNHIGSNTAIYINPAVSWLVYFPQKFTYTLIDETQEEIIDKRTFLYFGSYHLQAGIEQNLNSKMTLRLGVYGEKSMIPLGIENRKINILGIKAAILFNH